jgi:hypothetical protein
MNNTAAKACAGAAAILAWTEKRRDAGIGLAVHNGFKFLRITGDFALP